MRPETRQALADVRAAGSETIERAHLGWSDDRTLALAIERLLMIVGEGLVRVRSLEANILEDLTDGHRFIGMRNLLVHGYDDLDPSRIDEAIRFNLPALIAEINHQLGDSEP